MSNGYKIINRLKSLMLNLPDEHDFYFSVKGYPKVVESIRQIIFSSSSDRENAVNDILKLCYSRYFKGAITLGDSNYNLCNYNIDIIKIYNNWKNFDQKRDFFNITGDNYGSLKEESVSEKFLIGSLRSLITLFLLTVHTKYNEQ